MYKYKILISVLLMVFILVGGPIKAGQRGSLDRELASLIEKTGPYLVTVKGEGVGKDLIVTGIIFSEDGYVITSLPNFGEDEFEVTLAGGESCKAEPVGIDHETGLAVLKIKGNRQFKVPSWGAVSGLNEGDRVIFIGNSDDDPVTVNFGIFSGRDDDGFMKLGININPRISGGPILNTNGETVGILVAEDKLPGAIGLDAFAKAQSYYYVYGGFDRSGEGILAVPIDQAKSLAEELIKHGMIRRGFLGIIQKNLTKDQKKENNINGGVLIVDVTDDSPADKSGLREDDVIIEIDGKTISETSDLYNEIRSHKPGEKVSISYIRDGRTRKAEVELGESEGDYFPGGLDVAKSFPKLKAGGKYKFLPTENLEDEMTRMKEEIERLRLELNELKDSMKD